MAPSSSSFIPTPLAHADNQGEGHPRGAPLQTYPLLLQKEIAGIGNSSATLFSFALQLPSQSVPDMLYRGEVWRPGWPIHTANILALLKFVDLKSSIWPHVIVL
ncbi:hypothetical protein TNCV_2844161 [Trichonephila clavipes]|nr:hypothetical protein TNCV_2844161 [Trichonephila clavipes]